MIFHSSIRALFVFSAVLIVSACDSSDSDSTVDRPRLTAFNAVIDLPEITFLREEEVWGDMDYGIESGSREIDADQYDVNFDVLLPGDDTASCQGDIDFDDFKDEDECTRLASESINVLSGNEYIAAIIGSFDEFSVQVYDKSIHEFDTTEDDGDPEDVNAEIWFFHWSGQIGPVDIYLEEPGTNLSAVQVRGTLERTGSFNDFIDEGEYVLSITAVGDPNSPVYTSEAFEITRYTTVGFAILDGTLETTSAVRISRFLDQGGDLLDRRIETELRIVHSSPTAGSIDIYANENFLEPIVVGLESSQATPYAVVNSTDLDGYQLDVTPAGNVGTLLTRELIALTSGTRNTVYLVDAVSGNLDSLQALDRFRRLAPFAALRTVNSTGRNIDLYVIPENNNVFTSNVTETLSNGSIGTVLQFDPGDYDIWVAEAGTDLFLAGPIDVSLAGNGVYSIVAVATADAIQASLLLLDDFTTTE